MPHLEWRSWIVPNKARALSLSSLDYEPKKGEVQDMIWEVDETMDGTVSYLEFSLMYRRVGLFLFCLISYLNMIWDLRTIA